jgi:transposase-like protein
MPVVDKVLTKTMRAQYLKEGGVSCPFCRESDISGGFVETEHGSCFQRITCSDCGSTWTDEYRLVNLSQ